MEEKKVLVHPRALSETQRATTPRILDIANLVMDYKMGKVTVPALRSISLQVDRGEFVSIMGSSGSGKSTLLHIIGGLLAPTAGRILVAGHDIAAVSDRERTEIRRSEIGFVFQRFNLFPTLSVEDNIRLAERIYAGAGPAYSGNSSRRLEILSLLGLNGKRGHKPSELSGGEQQRVALARAIVNRPSLLLADEPTGNLDSANSEIVLDMLRKLNRETGQTILMITHNREAADYSQRTIRMKDGRIILDTSRAHYWDDPLPHERFKLG